MAPRTKPAPKPTSVPSLLPPVSAGTVTWVYTADTFALYTGPWHDVGRYALGNPLPARLQRMGYARYGKEGGSSMAFHAGMWGFDVFARKANYQPHKTTALDGHYLTSSHQFAVYLSIDGERSIIFCSTLPDLLHFLHHYAPVLSLLERQEECEEEDEIDEES